MYKKNYYLLIDDTECQSPGAEAPNIQVLIGVLVEENTLYTTLEPIIQSAIMGALASKGMLADFSKNKYPFKHSMGEKGKLPNYYRSKELIREMQVLQSFGWRRGLLETTATVTPV